MNTPNDGGPAFPVPSVGTGDPRDGMTTGSSGMSLRDWFAGMALSGMLQREHAFAFLDDDPSSGHTVAATTNNYARAAYNVSDAMIAARMVQATSTHKPPSDAATGTPEGKEGVL